MRVLVTGGTGRLAEHLFASPGASDMTWRILSRRPASARHEVVNGDLSAGTGVAEAVRDVDAILHLASDPAHPEHDVRSAEHLVRAAATARVAHLVYLSIVGVDRIPYRYYQAKHAAEGIVAGGGTAWTIVRATQFHSFIDSLLSRAVRIPGLILVPAGVAVQSVADGEVAARLINALRAGPAGRARDFAGPEILPAKTVARAWRTARRFRRRVVSVPIPGAVARAFRTGANTAPAGDRGRETWAEWLRTRYGARV